MRLDKLTTKLQEVLSDAQSQAVGNDNQYIEPAHVLLALLNQDDSGARSLLQRAGKLDPVIGRDDEIRRAIQVLQRRT